MTAPNPPRRRAGDAKSKAFALVVSSTLRRGPQGDVWCGRRHVVCQLTCGHTILRVSPRHFWRGEKVVCPVCTKVHANAQLPLPMELTPR
jgi:hypothetical protein